MTDTSPAATLRAAADKLRELVSAATPVTWWAEELPPNEHHKHPAHWVKAEYDDGDGCTSSLVVADCPWRQADADYIAAMHPGVGLALAQWLETEAASNAGDEDHGGCTTTTCSLVAALAVARAVLGEETR